MEEQRTNGRNSFFAQYIPSSRCSKLSILATSMYELCLCFVGSQQLSFTCKQLQQKSTPEDAEIVSKLDDIEAKLKDMLKKLEQFQIKNADNVFNTG